MHDDDIMLKIMLITPIKSLIDNDLGICLIVDNLLIFS